MKTVSKATLLILSLFLFVLSFSQVDSSATEGPVSIEYCTINPISDRTYTGNEITPGITLMMGETKISSSNYTLTYKNNINAGTATVTATGTGDYCGSVSADFNIVPKNNTPKIFFENNKLEYNGKLQKPVITKITVGTDLKELSPSDYTVSYPTDSINKGTYTVTVTLKGNYNGQNTRDFYIVRRDISTTQISLEKTSLPYTGKAVQPAVKVTIDGMTLKKDVDYTLIYSGNINAGSRNVLIEGIGNFSGGIKKAFTITTVPITKATVTKIADMPYTGLYQKPLPAITWNGQTLKNGTDYTLSYKNNLSAGTATVTATGKGNFFGEISSTFKITPLPISDYKIEEIGNRTYTGSEIIPGVKLMKGETRLSPTQYTLSFKNNVNAGTATVTATGNGNYIGSVSAKFKIVPKNHTPRIYLSENVFEYDGTVKKPKVTKVTVGTPEKKLDPSQYTIKYSSDRKNAGTYHVTVTLRNNYAGKNSRNFIITPQHISKATVKLSKRTYTYSGKTFTPKVTVTANGVTLKKGTDYKVYYTTNKQPGTGNVIIEGIGNFKGKSASQQFLIRKDIQKFKVTPKADVFKVSFAKLEKANQSLPVSKTLQISGSTGAITYDLGYSSAGYFTVDQSTGTIYVAKGTPKGTYELTLRLCAQGNNNIMMCYRLVDLKINVK